MFKNTRKFVVVMKKENYDFVRLMIDDLYEYNPIGHAGGKGIFDSHISVGEDIKENNTIIEFRSPRYNNRRCWMVLEALMNDEKILSISAEL